MSISNTSIVHSFLWKLMERCLVQGVSFVVSILLARWLMPADYGVVVLVLTFLNIANVIVDGGFNQALIQTKDCTARDYSTIFHLSVGVSLLAYGVLFLTAPWFSDLFHNEQFASAIRVMGLALPFYAVNSVQRAYMSRNLLFKSQFKSSFPAVVVSGVVGVVMAYLDQGVWALVAYHLSNIILTVIAMFCTIPWRPTIAFSSESFYRLFGFGWKIFLSNLMISLFLNVRSLVVGMLYKPSMLAFFDRGKNFPTLIMDNINASLQSVLFPVFSAEQNNVAKVKALVSRSIKTSSLVIFPMLFGLAAVAHPLVVTLLTERWIEAVPFLQIFCMAFLLMPIQIANMEAIKSLGYSDITLKLEIVKKVLEFGILIASVYINVYAIAAGTVLYNLICIFINLSPSKRLLDYGLTEQLRDAMPSFWAAMVMALCIYPIQYLPLHGCVVLVLQMLAGAILYISLCYVFKIEGFYYIMNMLNNKRIKK